ncbi:hypothetical protein [Geodermatophilus sabuli]|uniref:Uncharacterized protein n=1 Tax=Geodermatophilus sabuli TaxID=1564158 RepID=A0A285EEN1_9ACTN|nr:hypothetical protein [Geodermatophilus sabuli]MBB3086214.1 hypothetical protein [Geodermatophilus sabuli]SNX97569.1 hypothetical protein SAMN06893097_107213 [Geodermatophilus sabuli]
MSAPTPCYRHRTWLVHCEDCTTWHLARAVAARDAASSTATASVLTLVPTGSRRPVVVPIAA